MKPAWRVARFLVLLAVSVILFFGFFQRKLLYYPTRISEQEARETAHLLGLEPWTAEGKQQGWKQDQPSTRAHVVVFHGNAGNALDRHYYVEALGRDGWEIHLFEYPGYGMRTGKPSQSAFVAAAIQAVRNLSTSEIPVVVVGESIGAGVAAEVSAAVPEVRALLLVTPFHDLATVAQVHFPYLPVRWMLRDRFEAAKALKKYRGPLAVLLAGKDRVVPAKEGRHLYESYCGPKRLWIQPEADHNDLDVTPEAPWWAEVRSYFETHLP